MTNTSREPLESRRNELLAHARDVISEGPFAAEWASLQNKNTPAWYRDAKFGIFIHWLVSSVPAFGTEWYARNMYIEGTPEYEHHRTTYGDQRSFGFKEFLDSFTGQRFDPDEWIAVVLRSGAKYVVPVAEHHDGFALYDSSLTPWNSTRMGPQRDVIGELADAARRNGLAFGLSNHRAENWWFFNGGRRFDSDVNDPENAALYGPARSISTQPDRDFLEDWFARLVELVDRYHPEVVWFDWWIEQAAFEPYLREFTAYYYNSAHGHEPVINYKWDAFAPGSAVYAVERGSVRSIEPAYFQNDTSLSRVGWGYLTHNVYKTAADIVGELIDVVSKNGALLLNIGPAPDGSIPEAERRILEAVGDWLVVNGQAVYGTRPWVVYGEGPTVQPFGSFSDTASIPWTESDIRYTTGGEVVFAAFFIWPRSATVTLRTFHSLLRVFQGIAVDVALLGSDEPIEWSVEADGLRITIPRARPTPISPVFAITIREPAPVERHEPEFPK